MIHKLYMPKFGANIESATIVEWLKREGDPVQKGEIIARVETTKSLFDIEAEESGILRKTLAAPEQEIPFNRVIAIIADKQDNIEPVLAEIANQKVDQSAEFIKKMDASVFIGDRTTVVSPARQKITPAARRLMRDHQLPEESLSGLEKEVVQEKDIEDLLRSERVYIYGASTGAKQIMEILRSAARYTVAGIIDDNKEFLGKKVWGIEVMGDGEWLEKRYQQNPDFGTMIASHSMNRKKIYDKLKQHNASWKLPAIIDKRAILLSGVKVGESSLIEAGVILGHEVNIGKNVIVNIGAKMSHNCVIGNHSHIAIGAAISAAVVLEENVFVGAGVAVNPGVTIGENSIIAPGSAVVTDIPENVIVQGMPGKIVGESKRGR